MSATVSAAAFRNALESVRWAAETRQPIPALTCVLIEAAGHALSLTCTDLDVRATYTVTSETDAGSWRAAVPVSAVRKAVTGEGALTIAPAGASVRFELDGRATMIPKPDDDTALDVMPVSRDFNGAALEFEACDVAQLAARTLFAVSTEETRYYLNGVYLHRPDARKPAKFRAVATDGHRMAILDVAPRSIRGEWRESIIPRRLVSALGKVAGAKEAGPLLIEQPTAGFGLQITYGALVVVAKEIDGTFPDYGRCVPRYRADSKVARLTVSARELDAAIKGMGGKRDKWAVDLCMQPGAPLRVYGSGKGGVIDLDLSAEVSGRTLTIGFQAEYLREAMRAFGGESVVLMAAGPKEPAVLTGKRGYMIVMMPYGEGQVPARPEAAQFAPSAVDPAVAAEAEPMKEERATMGAQLVHHAAPVCPLDLECYDSEANPDAGTAEAIALAKVPQWVLERVRAALATLQAFAARHGMEPGDVAGPLSVLSSRYLARRNRMSQAVETFRAATMDELCNAQNPETYATCGTLVPADDGAGSVRYEALAAPDDGTFAAFMRETFGLRWAIGRKRRGSDRVWITKRQYDAARQAWEARQAAQLRCAPNVVVLADWANRRIGSDSGAGTMREACREGPLMAG